MFVLFISKARNNMLLWLLLKSSSFRRAPPKLKIIQKLHNAAKWLQYTWDFMNKIEVKI